MKNKKFNSYFTNFIKGSLTVLFSVLVIYGVARANTTIIPPSGTPVASFYTLSDIWTRLTTNGAAGTHSFLFADPLAGTHVTLTQIYNAIPIIDATKVLSGTSYLGIPGTMTDKAATSYTPSNVAQTIVAGYYNGSGTVATDAFLLTGNIKSGVTIFGVGGKTEVVDTTEATVPIASGTVSSGKKGFVNGALITGTMPANYAYGDNNIAYVLGVATGAGTALKNLWNGTGQGFTGGSQADGGVDDYNANTAVPVGRYSKNWTTCAATSDPCGINNSGSAFRDDSTGLIWSKKMNITTFALDDVNGQHTWFSANNCNETTGSACTKKLSSKTGCEADINAGWSLPTQKQLMQAYIDGSYGNMEPALGSYRNYWSSTTLSSSTTTAWYTGLSLGATDPNTKTNALSVRCVRSAP